VLGIIEKEAREVAVILCISSAWKMREF